VKTIGLVAALIAAIAALVFRPRAPEATFAAATQASQHHGRARSVRSPAPLDVYVVGAVAKPGVYPIPANARVIDALRLAGGPLSDADFDSINLAAHVSDGEKIAVETRGQRLAREARATPRARKTATPKAPRSTRVSAKRALPMTDSVDINAASVDELAALPGVGTALARRIADYRDLNGPFDSIDDLADVDGITARTIDSIAPYVIVR
jgi:competence protein ComEA